MKLIEVVALCTVLSTASVCISAGASPQIRYYVDGDASGPIHDGSSWSNAFLNVQHALDVAEIDIQSAPGSGTYVEIWVAEGTYKPTYRRDSAIPRSDSFFLVPRVALYGGFKGLESSLSERDLPKFSRSPTVLSCDMSDDDLIAEFAINARYLHPHFQDNLPLYKLLPGHEDHDSRAENCAHVIYADSDDGPGEPQIDGSTIMDGFTVAGGQADLTQFGGSPGLLDESGGGLFASDDASPHLTNMWFEYNYAFSEGGAINTRGPISVTDSVFASNHAATGNGGAIAPGTHDGAIMDGAVFSNLKFIRNVSVSEGGAVNVISAENVTLDRCDFSYNYSVFSGGAISLSNNATATIKNSTFWKNTAGAGDLLLVYDSTPATSPAVGGAISIANDSSAVVRNVTMVENGVMSTSSGSFGGAIAVWLAADAGLTTISNSILWANYVQNGSGQEVQCPFDDQFPERCQIEYSIVNNYDPEDSTNDILIGRIIIDSETIWTQDPQFMVYPTGSIDLHLTADSPALDVGTEADPNVKLELDIDGEPRSIASRCQTDNDSWVVDIGSDERYYPVCWFRTTQCYGDANLDGTVNALDRSIFVAADGTSYGQANYSECADINRDGDVDSDDSDIMLIHMWTNPAPDSCDCDDPWPPQ